MTTGTGSKTDTLAERAKEADEFVTALLVASRVLVGVSARSIADVEDTVTLPQFRTLVVLDVNGEISLLRLAEILDVTSSTAVRMIDRLLAAGLATRRDNPANRRQVLLGLTPEGHGVVRRVTAKRRREISRIVAKVPPGQRTDLIIALHQFAIAAGEPGSGDPTPGADEW